MDDIILSKLNEIEQRLSGIESLLQKRKTRERRTPVSDPPYLEIVDLWNGTPGLKPAMVHVDGRGGRTISPLLKTRIKSCWLEHHTIDWYAQLFTRVAMSDFLTGRTGHFIATLDWVVRPINREKILNGNYDNGARTTVSSNGRGRVALKELLG